MNQTDARNFINALNNISAYVPPMLMQAVISSPICRDIETAANPPPDAQQPERPKPHAVG